MKTKLRNVKTYSVDAQASRISSIVFEIYQLLCTVKMSWSGGNKMVRPRLTRCFQLSYLEAVFILPEVLGTNEEAVLRQVFRKPEQ